jgi:stage IV sporulation protein FB
MLRFNLFGFPVFIHWMFWLNTALMGGALGAGTPEAFRSVLAWVLAVLVSILIHELGHAFAMRGFGDHRVGIVLYAFGGYAQGSRLYTRAQDIQLTAAGPGLQIAAGLAVGWAMTLWRVPNPWLREFCDSFTVVSIFWALLGKMRTALVISLVCAIVLALSALDTRAWVDMQTAILRLIDIRAGTRIGGGLFALLFFGMMAMNNWKQLRGEPQIPWMNAR